MRFEDKYSNMNKLTKEILIKEIKDYYEKFKCIPSAQNRYDNGIHPTITYRKFFGSWNNAIIAAGFEPFKRPGRVECKCVQCNKLFTRNPATFKHKGVKTNHIFCSQSCAATYNNTHKTTGCRRSKLESYIEQQLIKDFPNLEIHFNRKDTIDSELDCYIPSLKLAFELNGVFHYEPIFSNEKLKQIQNNDQRKFQACLERQIEFCIINVSKLNRFKESNAKPYYDIIKNIVNKKLQIAHGLPGWI